MFADANTFDEIQPPMKRMKYSQRCSVTQLTLKKAVHFAEPDQEVPNQPRTVDVNMRANENTRKYQRRCSVTEQTMRAASILVRSLHDLNSEDNEIDEFHGATTSENRLAVANKEVVPSDSCGIVCNGSQIGLLNTKQRSLRCSYDVEAFQRNEKPRQLQQCRLSAN
jgi:hypothetical protein